MDLGIFLPITNNGWIISRASPQFSPSFAMNKDITLRAEAMGFEFAFSMVKWRGFGGDLGFWDQALESFTLMAGLASVTTTIELIASLQPLTFHPAVAARMAMTIDNISNGRFGINLVGGANRREYTPMGLWPGDDYYIERYDHLAEWTEIVKELWETGRSNRKGEYYALEDCLLDPLPIRKPHPPIISAGMSDRGIAFATRHADASFVAGFDLDVTKELADRVRAAAADAGRQVRCYGTFTIIGGASDDEANARLKAFDEGADLETLAKIGGGRRADVTAKGTRNEIQRGMLDRGSSVFTPTLVGSPDTIVEQFRWLSGETALDGVMLTFPDWFSDLDDFGRQVVPRLQVAGLM
jgi:pyrimidine oxygenase